MSRKVGMTRFSLDLPYLYGRVSLSFLLALCLSVTAVAFISESFGGEESQPLSPEEEFFYKPDFASLNVRLNTKPMTPPGHMVKRTLLLENLQGGLSLAEGSIRSAIIEDDARRQVLILSAQGTVEPHDPIHVYLLYDFDLESRIPTLKQCTQQRQCAQDRQPGTGGLACIAICMVKALHPPIS